MQLFLIRHAEAVDETRALVDVARYLTHHGRTQAGALGERLRWHDCVPSVIWTSPLVRAVQTAELVAARLEHEREVVVQPSLAPEGDVHAAQALLGAEPKDAVIVAVGHEPGLSALAALVVGDPTFAALRKAEAVRIDRGAVRWWFAFDDEAPRQRR